MLLNLLRAEWLRLRKSPLALILLALFLLLLVIQIALQLLVSLMAQGLGGVSVQMFPEPQLIQFRAGATLPGAIGTALGHGNGLGGVFAIILTAGVLGNEYSWGTLRTQLARQPRRALLLCAKLLALLGLLALALLLAVALGAALGALGDAVLGASPNPATSLITTLPLGLLRSLYVLLPYVLLTTAFTTLGRSTLAGIAGGLFYLTLEVGLGGLTLSRLLGGSWQALYNLTIGQNINTLVVLNSRSFGLDPAAISNLNLQSLPSPTQAVLVVALYSASFLATAIMLLRRRDIPGPT